MNAEEHLEFLAAHQPMEDHPDEDVMNRFLQAISFFQKNPDEACIPLFLNCFANWDDLEVFDSVQMLLRRFPASLVRPHLKQALESPNEAVRQWSLDVTRYFVDDSFLPYLQEAFEEEDSIIRMTAAAVLEVLGTPDARKLAKRLLLTEKEDDVLEILEAV